MKIVDAHMHLKSDHKSLKDAEKLVNSGVIDKGWLICDEQLSFHSSGDDILKVSKAFPDFFVPFAHLDFNKPASHIDDLKAQGYAGVKALFPPKPLEDESFFPLYERAEKNKMIAIFHAAGAMARPEHHYGNIKKDAWGARYMHVFQLDIIAKMFPKLIIVIAHLGCPWFDEAINVLEGHPNVFADMSNGRLIGNMDVTNKAVHKPKLEDKLMFGVDSGLDPDYILKYRNFWELYLKQNVSHTVYEKIMGLNAERVLDMHNNI